MHSISLISPPSCILQHLPHERNHIRLTTTLVQGPQPTVPPHPSNSPSPRRLPLFYPPPNHHQSTIAIPHGPPGPPKGSLRPGIDAFEGKCLRLIPLWEVPSIIGRDTWLACPVTTFKHRFTPASCQQHRLQLRHHGILLH